MDVMTKLRYFLIIQIHDLSTLVIEHCLNMIWRLSKDVDLPELWAYEHFKGQKIENKASKNIVLSSLRPWTKIASWHEQV